MFPGPTTANCMRIVPHAVRSRSSLAMRQRQLPSRKWCPNCNPDRCCAEWPELVSSTHQGQTTSFGNPAGTFARGEGVYAISLYGNWVLARCSLLIRKLGKAAPRNPEQDAGDGPACADQFCFGA